MNAEVRFDFGDLRRIARQSARMAPTAAKTVKRETQRFAEYLVKDASEKAPLGDTGHLKRSGWQETTLTSNGVHARITFGGIVAAYAEVQHENPGFVHTEAGYVAKYHRPLSRRMTLRKYHTETIAGRMTKKGVLSIASRTSLKARPRKHRLGYYGGQAHFLYGRADSAFNDAAQARFARRLAFAIDEMAAKELR